MAKCAELVTHRRRMTKEGEGEITDDRGQRFPGFGEYQENTDRIIPVVALDRP